MQSQLNPQPNPPPSSTRRIWKAGRQSRVRHALGNSWATKTHKYPTVFVGFLLFFSFLFFRRDTNVAKSKALAKPKEKRKTISGERQGERYEGRGEWEWVRGAQHTAGNFMRIMTIIVIKSKMLSNCLINLLCKLCVCMLVCVCGKGKGGQFRVAAVGRRHFTISIKTSTI